ncbi:TonB-dependent receptor [Flavobacteriaceae bacterium]|nr:TonB-dependent receptor [Flavobacteriaceae bacterium]MDB4590734.1 TonB-dependent receptor [Flavobacteriaceae bacterium]MDC6467454.1 TonB-dependent receptor [Flavobacteriaceae bacterium]
MKKLLCTLALSLMLVNLNAQEKIQDTIKTQILDEVLVKSIRVDTDSPITHSNVDKEELAKTNLGQDIPVLLNYLPSVVTTSDAGAGIGYTYIRVRGSDASRVNITINGIPYNDSESQGTFWVNMPDFASSIENLQLQRGVGTSTNGSGSFGASLNILSDGVSDNAFSEIGIAGGSFNSQKYNVKFSTGLLNDHFEVSGRLSKITSDGYIDRASSDLKSYFLQGAFINDNTLIKALVFGGKEKTYQAWYGIDAETLENDRTYNPAGIYTDDDGNVKFYDNETDNYSQDHYQLFWNQKINNNWTTNLALNYTYGRGYYEQYKEDEDFVFYNFEPIVLGGEVINTTDLIRRRWLDNDFYVINANANYKKDNLEVSTGIFYSHYDGDHYGEVIWAKYASNSEIRDRYYEGNGKKNEFTVFAKATYKFKEKWSIYGDLQGRFLTYKTSGLTSDRVPLEVNEKYNFFNPKTGLSYELSNKNQLYVSYGKAHREPRRADFENGITKPEKLDDYELGWRFKAQKNTINTNIYFMNYKDQLVLTGAIDDTGAPLRATSGKSYRLGLEIDATFLIGDNFRILPNLALSSNKNLDFVSPIDGELVNLGTTNLSFSPNIVAGNKFEYEPITNLQLGLYTKYVGEQYMGNVDSDVSKLDAYFVNDFNVSYTIDNIPFLREIVVTGLVNNIFNIKYVSNGYYYTYDDTWTDPTTTTTIEGTGYYPQATINFLVGAAVKF